MSQSLKNKLRYISACAIKTLRSRDFACPSCMNKHSVIVDRIWLFTSLRRCDACKLLYRAPTTSAQENAAFYQTEYQQGVTTDLPTDQELVALVRAQFAGHEKNYDSYLDVLRALGKPDAKLLDFGCSWGYGSYQLARAGYAVDAYEISKPRAEYARTKLNVSTKQLAELEHGTYDIFFSAHVIEHVPSVSKMITLGMQCLKPDGLFIAFTPNGSDASRARNPEAWHKQWGLVHPQFIDDAYLRHQFQNMPLLVATTPYPLEQIAQWPRAAQPFITNAQGGELMFAAQKRA